MATVTVHTNIDELPDLLKGFGDQIPYATSVALNETAFGLMREEKHELVRNLDIKNTWTHRGQRVVKAKKGKLVAHVGNVRWYMDTLVRGGRRRALIGIVYEGQKYLLVPSSEMKTATGKLRRIPKKNKPFVFESESGDLFLAYRKTKKRLPLQVVGRLVDETMYEESIYPHREISNKFIHQHWLDNWQEAMLKAARTAR